MQKYLSELPQKLTLGGASCQKSCILNLSAKPTANPSGNLQGISSTPTTRNGKKFNSYHRNPSHSIKDCLILQAIKTIALLENLSASSRQLILMAKKYANNNREALFILNCQIKHKLAQLIIDDDSQKNIVSRFNFPNSWCTNASYQPLPILDHTNFSGLQYINN
jgi:hypothetical protein